MMNSDSSLCQCFENYEYDLIQHKCLLVCDVKCETCFDTTDTSCTGCTDGNYLWPDSSTCQGYCPSGTTEVGTEC